MPAGVEPVMTPAAEHDEILFARPQLASPYYVMDLELIAPAAVLTLPVVPLENLPAQFLVVRCRQAKPPAVGSFCAHAERLISCTNLCCCGAGGKWNRRSTDPNSTSGLPFSRFAPARKVAQIISNLFKLLCLT